MSDGENLDDIILYPGPVSELREVMRDVTVRIAALEMIRNNYWTEIQHTESKFRKILKKRGYAGVVHYSILPLAGGYNHIHTRYMCQGIPIIIMPHNYRTNAR